MFIDLPRPALRRCGFAGSETCSARRILSGSSEVKNFIPFDNARDVVDHIAYGIDVLLESVANAHPNLMAVAAVEAFQSVRERASIALSERDADAVISVFEVAHEKARSLGATDAQAGQGDLSARND